MSPRRQPSGFSLLEVMCAILVLGIGLAGLTQGITQALSSSKESEMQTAAVLIASGQIEALRTDGFLEEGDTEGELTGALSLYRWKQSITTTPIDGLYEVKVRVDHAESGATLYELQTLLFDASNLSLEDTASARRDAPGSHGKRDQRP